ncbi:MULTISPECIES: hypothetical protein [unclassified Bartonella]|uniref:hypothetical protein n=1 Tax=Bartonella TaxID=773 RepID=UPI00099A5E23|nr:MULTISPECIES: hypothetical protein [unclassified Bartonella]AQX18593.1 hypothetical protein BA1379B_007690 [Bartonella sp. A1379B]AQX23107.1 hypothetical protein Bho11B_011080 [Bartonella sp. 11B]AQX23594.1 hypothetical protein Bho114_002520 [Bartonella sp. 114]AQX25562.1 hypothetical protein Bco22_008880 [Bartonella sp. Coyote22sub2]
MKPRGVASTMHFAALMPQIAFSKNEVQQTQKLTKMAPIVEPMPHYPLSANISDMLAHINELIRQEIMKPVTDNDNFFFLNAEEEYKYQPMQQREMVKKEELPTAQKADGKLIAIEKESAA